MCENFYFEGEEKIKNAIQVSEEGGEKVVLVLFTRNALQGAKG